MARMFLVVTMLVLISHAEKAAHAGAGWPAEQTCDCEVIPSDLGLGTASD